MLLVWNIPRPQFSNYYNRRYLWHTTTSWHKQKPYTNCFIITHTYTRSPNILILHITESDAITAIHQDWKYRRFQLLNLYNNSSFQTVTNGWSWSLMYYTSQTKTDSLVRIPVLIDRSLHTYSPCSTHTIYVMHHSPCVTTPDTNLHFQHQISAAIYNDTIKNAQSCVYTVTLHLNVKNSYKV